MEDRCSNKWISFWEYFCIFITPLSLKVFIYHRGIVSFIFITLQNLSFWFTLRPCVNCINWASGPVAAVYVEATLFFCFKVGKLLLPFILNVSKSAVSSESCVGEKTLEILRVPGASVSLVAPLWDGSPTFLLEHVRVVLTFWENTYCSWSTDC